jgi:hypothetical protein
MNNQASNPTPGTAADTKRRPVYQLTHILAMLAREEEAKKASQPQEEKRR